ncbi:18504_t:CDS:2 [Funneliformis geosporum]|uniref:1092_t:CDS:1 n=1 Tax=Funneliformis geosporum TaxID=1117311 RepID=A0A9W4T0E8_9GLOM|nr:1092_t:CDS:2 [Funneliformis geosporum]CAI2188165.1 18504_t:CDS:2 [Funneliformis geosporum]
MLFVGALAQVEDQDVPINLDTPDNRKNLHTVVYSTLAMIVISLCGCLYVFYRTYNQWKFNKSRKKSLMMIYKLPFYTACTALGKSMGGIGNAIQYMINEGIVASASTGFESPNIELIRTNNESNDNSYMKNINYVNETNKEKHSDDSDDANIMDKNENSNIIFNNENNN